MSGEAGEAVRQAILKVGPDSRTFVVKTIDTVADVTEEALGGAKSLVHRHTVGAFASRGSGARSLESGNRGSEMQSRRPS